MTLKEAQKYVSSLGLTLRHSFGEYRVNFKGGKEATAYYTNDIKDAVSTAECMRDEALAPNHPFRRKLK